MNWRIFFLSALYLALTSPHRAPGDTLADKYLTSGQLAEGETALIEHLKANPDDNQTRFGLGAIQFLLAFEHVGTTLYENGLLTRPLRRNWGEVVPAPVKDPEQFSYDDMRQMLQTFIDDVSKAEQTLAGIDDEYVQLPLKVAQIKIDFFGTGEPISAALLFGESPRAAANEAVQQMVIDFDRGDVEWLRGYCHVLSGVCEIFLAVDCQELFERTGHLFFSNIETPYEYLLEERHALDDGNMMAILGDSRAISDIISFIHLMRFPMKEPGRMQASLEHFESTIGHARKMWEFYEKETDDAREWIPNPQQSGALQIPISRAMVDRWQETIDEAERVLNGEALIPFWRGTNRRRGINLRRVFTEPRMIDPILWIQGTAAEAYLEEGDIIKFADPETLRDLNDTFGGVDFFGFAFWFN